MTAALTLGALALATGSAVAAPGDNGNGRAAAGPQSDEGHAITADWTDAWTLEEAREIQRDDSNTLPLYDEVPVDPISDEVWLWDTWPLTGLDTQTEQVDGWRIAFSLTADKDIAFPDRHWSAEIGYSISRDGKSWEYQGDLFPEDVNPPGDREWAGSSLIVDGRLYAFYTASGEEGVTDDKDPRYMRQRLAMASAKINTSSEGVWFSDWTDHKIIAEADGEHYQTLEQSVGTGIIYGFRDPWVFENPEDGKIYMLFEGNTAGSTVECDDPDSESYNGNVGIAASVDGSLEDFELLPPLLHANCVNQQLERPHATFQGGDVYLWTISHKFTFSPSVRGADRAGLPDGLYGFVGPTLRSDYTPLNESALVVATPAKNNTQSYSWYAMPGGFVESFMDNVEGEYVGSLAPSLKLSIRGNDTTKIAKVYDTPFIP